MDFGVLAVLLGSIALGISASVASTWNLRRTLYRLQLDVGDLQQRLLTENKRKAADARWAKPDKMAVEAQYLVSAASQPTQKNPWDIL